MKAKDIWAPSAGAAVRSSWAPIAVFGAHVVASRVLHAYLLFPPLDIPMHFLGGVAIAFFFAKSLGALPEEVLPEVGRSQLVPLFVAALTCSATVLWEFAEFISDHAFGTHAQLGLADTLGDMVTGLAGGLCFLVGAWLLGSFARVRSPDASRGVR